MSTAEAFTSKRRRTNVARACFNCRRRKAKCDGVFPTCKSCATYNDECQWLEKDDGRKPASRQYVHSLHNRIKLLESLLQAKGHALPSEQGDSEDLDACEEEDASDRMPQVLQHIHVAEGDEEIKVHGPTSAYAYQASGRATYPPPSSTTQMGLHEDSYDFRRYLPPDIPLTHAQHFTAIERFFLFFASVTLRGVQEQFYSDMEQMIHRPEHYRPNVTTQYSPYLHNIALAVALSFADEDYLRASSVRAIFASHAHSFLEAELARPTIALVQGLAIKSTYHSTLNEPATGWTYFAMAIRTAQSMGLNIDCSPIVDSGKMTKEEMMLRRNTFWSLFSQNQCWALYIGRENPEQEHNVPLPIAETALDNQAWVWISAGPKHEVLPPQPGALSTTFVHFARLAVIMAQVMKKIYSLNSDIAKLQENDTISRLSLSLDAWTEDLPPPLVLHGAALQSAPPHVILLALHREWVSILIHRPCYRPTVNLRRQISGSEGGLMELSVKRCDKSAARIMVLLRTYHSRFGLRFTTPSAQIIAFTAGTTFLLAAVHHPSKKLKNGALQSVGECIELLRYAAQSWPAAEHHATTLETLMREYHPPSPSIAMNLRNQGQPAASGSSMVSSGQDHPDLPEATQGWNAGFSGAKVEDSDMLPNLGAEEPASASTDSQFFRDSVGLSSDLLSTTLNAPTYTLDDEDAFLKSLFSHINLPTSSFMDGFAQQEGQASDTALPSWPAIQPSAGLPEGTSFDLPPPDSYTGPTDLDLNGSNDWLDLPGLARIQQEIDEILSVSQTQ